MRVYDSRWSHRKGDCYVLIVASAVGNETAGFKIAHYMPTGDYPSIAAAKRAGLGELDRSDDFNIGAVRDGRLRAVTWMGEIVDDDPSFMDRLASEIGLEP